MTTMAEYDTMDAAHTALFADLKKDIAASQPASLLLCTVSDVSAEQALPVSNTTFINSTEALLGYLESPPAKQKFDLAIIIFIAEDIEDDNYIHLISKLRDTDCARVYIACSMLSKTADKYYDARLRALGFKLLHIYKTQPTDERNIYFYYYDIYDYKEVPDWFNDRFWANPRMWDKARW